MKIVMVSCREVFMESHRWINLLVLFLMRENIADRKFDHVTFCEKLSLKLTKLMMEFLFSCSVREKMSRKYDEYLLMLSKEWNFLEVCRADLKFLL